MSKAQLLTGEGGRERESKSKRWQMEVAPGSMHLLVKCLWASSMWVEEVGGTKIVGEGWQNSIGASQLFARL